MRLIDADKLKQHFAWWHEGGEEADRQAEIFEQIIDVQPTVSIEQLKWERDTAIQQLRELGYDLGQKQKNGKWRIGKQIGPNSVTVYVDECPFCGSQRPCGENFCPHCGARMEASHVRDL